jgi:hypothetical protein
VPAIVKIDKFNGSYGGEDLDIYGILTGKDKDSQIDIIDTIEDEAFGDDDLFS